ncbi:MAG: hypothetical protein Q9223_005703 [Gallowayella weberi]
MENLSPRTRNIQSYCAKRVTEIVENLGKNRLWQRQLKNVAATTILVTICLVPVSSNILGKAAYLGAITTVFAHPGRRFGQLVEALILALAGASLGLAWSLLGVYLSSLVVHFNPPAAYSIRGAFLACALIFHGFLRSNTPRLFVFVLLLVIVSVVTLTSTATAVATASATQILYPILVAIGVILLINLFIFPEFSSSFLGETTIETLHDTAETLRKAGHYFIDSLKQPDALDPPIDSAGVNQGEKRDGIPEEHQTKSMVYSLFHRFLSSRKQSGPDCTNDASTVSLQDLVRAKAQMRSKLSTCKAAQTECNFEVAFAVLPPRQLKPISNQSMKRLVANVVAVIGACESKFALLGEEDEQVSHVNDGTEPNVGVIYSDTHESRNDVSIAHNSSAKVERTELDLIKPKRAIESGDARLLQYLLKRITVPYTKFNTALSQAVDCVTVCIAYAYDVSKLPSGARAPKGLVIEEVDLYTEELGEALRTFDSEITAALQGAVKIQGLDDQQLDMMPREEIFLVASFLLNLRQAATHIDEMLKTSRALVLQRQSRHDRRRFYAPRIKWSKWLSTGGEEVEALPATGRKRSRGGEQSEKADNDANSDMDLEENPINSPSTFKDLEAGLRTAQTLPNSHPQSATTTKAPVAPTPDLRKDEGVFLRLRGQMADGLEWAQGSDDLAYAIKLTVAVFLVTWPAFVARWNEWYSLNRGLWAALQLVFITEVSIGTSIMMFILRGIGTTVGCLWGWAALEARNGNRIVVAAMVCLGLIPSTYVQLGTKYPKAGMVCIVSICVVALSTELQTVPGSATENFLKRWLAFIIGGLVALLVEIAFLPVKARTRLVESLSAAIRQISEMETCIAAGIEHGRDIDIYDPKPLKGFERASKKAKGALTAAETFLPFCSNEPRIKGSFEALAEIYTEILFVLHQIVDRMDNMLQLRIAYGSGPLEELNAQIHPYRRNVAGSVNLTLFAVGTALTTKFSLPQFFPSPRLAHLRLINRVREVIQQNSLNDNNNTILTGNGEGPSEVQDVPDEVVQRRKYMAWNAASAARAEIIEYLEELIDLTKLLVGANEFRSGMLMRGSYHDYIRGLEGSTTAGKSTAGGENGEEAVVVDDDTRSEEKADEVAVEMTSRQPLGSVRRRRLTTIRSAGSGEEGVPASLQRIQSRKMEAGMRRQGTGEEWQ